MFDWTFALLFPPDLVKLSLDCEAALLLREVAAAGVLAESLDQGAARNGAGRASSQHRASVQGRKYRMVLSPRAGKPAPRGMLVDLAQRMGNGALTRRWAKRGEPGKETVHCPINAPQRTTSCTRYERSWHRPKQQERRSAISMLPIWCS